MRMPVVFCRLSLATSIVFLFISIIGEAFGSVDKNHLVIRHVESYINLYALNVKEYPSSLDELKNIKYDFSTDPSELNYYKDEWGNDLVYIYPAKYGTEKFDLYSIGANGIDEKGNGDDIANWRLDGRYDISQISWMDFLSVFTIFLVGFLLLRLRRKKHKI